MITVDNTSSDDVAALNLRRKLSKFSKQASKQFRNLEMVLCLFGLMVFVN